MRVTRVFIIPGFALAALLFTAGCSSPLPTPQLAVCPTPAQGTLLVSVREPEQAPIPLILRVQPEAGGVRYIAMDTLGNPQFNGLIAEQSVAVNRQPLYRGMSPENLISAVYWWQVREQLSAACMSQAGLSRIENNAEITLFANTKPVWQWRKAQPDSVILAPTKITLTLRTSSP
ncbi:hypothetical protein QWI17_18225 [Gilvimarinus sp. SDUM040013]|uniref:Lipoprotein n=1 Tax=Gilvimarinus gilvus TaxID=3058038 RepID=A0ABU4S1P4_9GAMM|nr:hypothetical protein [Gilvimarinus sp. SDUM040013]MDO3387786.1 hypothetical protein [Gilvimarinus sp. SDUM040013]MDX6851071.1 hypothetical protein [Gilvimarinus sp. SDUM040013]